MVLCVSDNVCCSFLSYRLSLLIHFKYFSLIASQCFNLLVKVSLHILNIYLHLLNIHYGDFFVKVLDRIPYFASVCLTLMQSLIFLNIKTLNYITDISVISGTPVILDSLIG